MFNWVNNLFSLYETTTEDKSLLEKIESLEKRIASLENQVLELQNENIETTNSIYEIANSLEARIDILMAEPYNLEKFSLDK